MLTFYFLSYFPNIPLFSLIYPLMGDYVVLLFPFKGPKTPRPRPRHTRAPKPLKNNFQGTCATLDMLFSNLKQTKASFAACRFYISAFVRFLEYMCMYIYIYPLTSTARHVSILFSYPISYILYLISHISHIPYLICITL